MILSTLRRLALAVVLLACSACGATSKNVEPVQITPGENYSFKISGFTYRLVNITLPDGRVVECLVEADDNEQNSTTAISCDWGSG